MLLYPEMHILIPINNKHIAVLYPYTNHMNANDVINEYTSSKENSHQLYKEYRELLELMKDIADNNHIELYVPLERLLHRVHNKILKQYEFKMDVVKQQLDKLQIIP